jgi:hypothetical protein
VTRAAALLAALSVAAACSPDAQQSCPGEAVGDFTFAATLAPGPLPEGLDPEPALTDCTALDFPPALAPFKGTLATDATAPPTSAGALCRSTGHVLFGTRTGRRWKVQTSSGGAVLDACGPTCAATSLVVIQGDVLPDLASADEFRGALVEKLTRSEGDCSACALPCAARYDLVGTAEAEP